MLEFESTYATLPARFYTAMTASSVSDPSFLAVNGDLAEALGSSEAEMRSALEVFAGNAAPPGAQPLAQVYGGHQFGHWSGQLGDGRALLLGEVVADGQRFDVQLKGAGRTPYSRSGDGRSALGPVVREFLVSEAMAALGVPTTRALVAVRTGDPVLRQTGWEPGGVLTRVAASHIRVGTFQWFASQGDREAVQALLDYALARHVPDANGRPLDLLAHVMRAQARLIAEWMGLGFIHGVMNTDNMTISGETIDYGPCAFMEGYAPGQVFSSIDQMGRYAYANQPDIALWNIAQLASALLILWKDQETGIAEMTEALNGFGDLYGLAWERKLAAKIGLEPEHMELGVELLELMAAGRSDFTNTFRALGTPAARDQIADRDAYDAWEARWRALGPDLDAMARVNPAVIPRNHRVQEAIAAADQGDDAPFHALWAVLRDPFTETQDNAPYRTPATPENAVTQTFCGT